MRLDDEAGQQARDGDLDGADRLFARQSGGGGQSQGDATTSKSASKPDDKIDKTKKKRKEQKKKKKEVKKEKKHAKTGELSDDLFRSLPRFGSCFARTYAHTR